MLVSVISLAMIGFGALGMVMGGLAGGIGGGFWFFLFFITFAAVSAWVMTFMARRQMDMLVDAEPAVVTKVIRKGFRASHGKR